MAHGFLVMSDEAIFTYKVDNPYSPKTEAGIRWNDPDLAIEWPIDLATVQTSEKDLKQPFFKEAELFE
jgi:dTDP-4-dehydrorhamnose 3,5-epimerase